MGTEVKGNGELTVAPSLKQEIVPSDNSLVLSKGNHRIAIQIENYRALHTIHSTLAFAQRNITNVAIEAFKNFRGHNKIQYQDISEGILFASGIAEIALLEEVLVPVKMGIRNTIWESIGGYFGETDWPIIELTDEQILAYLRPLVPLFNGKINFEEFITRQEVNDWIQETVESGGLSFSSKISSLARDYSRGHGDIKKINPDILIQTEYTNDENEALVQEMLRVFKNALRIIAQAGWKQGYTKGINQDMGGGIRMISQSGTPREMTLQLEDKDMAKTLWAWVSKWADRLYPEIDETKMITGNGVDGILENRR